MTKPYKPKAGDVCLWHGLEVLIASHEPTDDDKNCFIGYSVNSLKNNLYYDCHIDNLTLIYRP